MSLLTKIGDFFSSWFNGAKKAFKKLSPEVKDAMIAASKIIDIINENLQTAPAFVIELIQKQFPGLDLPKIEAIVKKVSDDLHIAEDVLGDDLEATVRKIQTLLANTRPANGTGWAKLSHTAYLAIAVLLSPVGTKLAAIVALAEYVYHDLIKGGKEVALFGGDLSIRNAA